MASAVTRRLPGRFVRACRATPVRRTAGIALVACASIATAVVAAVFGSPSWSSGFGGLWLVALLGLVEDDSIDRLVRKIRRVEAGEADVDFATDRDDEIGRLYDAVGDLATHADTSDSAESERYRRELYEITADTDLSDSEKVRELLELGRERFGLTNGLITTIDEASGDYEIETVVGGDFVEAGTRTQLMNTFCRRTIEADDVLGIYNATDEGYEDDPGYTEWGISCYLGGKITVEEEVYGTVCFVDPEPRERPFTDDEKLFLDLLSRWISHVYERRERERVLRETSEHLEAIVGASPAAIVALDTDGTIERWNPAAERIFGWREDEVLGCEPPFVQEAARAEFREYRDRLLAGETLQDVETTRMRKDGELIDVSLSAAPIRDNGEVVGVMAAIVDVCERKARERELAETTRKLEIALEGTNTGVWEWNLETDAVVWNRTLEELLGFEPGSFGGTFETFEQRVHPADLADVESAIEHALATEESYRAEFRIEHADGHWVWVAARGRLVDDERGRRMVGILNDVTERKERERELERYRAYTDELLDAIDDVFYVLDEEGRLQRYNETFAEVTGYTDAEMEATEATDFFPADERDTIETAIEEVLETGEARVESAFLTAEGDRVAYELCAARLADLDGNTVIVGIGRDIGERVEAERQLSRLISNIPGMVYRVENAPGWPTEFASDGARELTGYGPEELESGAISWEEIYANDTDPERIWRSVQAALEAEERFNLVYAIETADGERRWVEEHGRAVYGDDGDVEALEGVIVDVTDRITSERELERTRELLEQAQRLADVGGWEVQVVDGEPVDITVTDEIRRIHGLPDGSEFSSEEAVERIHPADRKWLQANVWEALEAGEAFDEELRIRTVDDELRWVRAIGDPILEDGELVAVRGSIQDVTERREREQELERTRDLLARAEEMADLGGWAVDLSEGEPADTEWTPKLYELFELPPDTDPPTVDVFEYYHPEDRERHREAVQQAVGTGSSWDQELRMVTAEGTERWVHNIGEAVSEDGEVVETRGSIQDITEPKRREQRLREREHELAAQREYTDDILDAIEDVFYVIDDEGNFLRYNDSLPDAGGYTEADIAETNALEFFREEDLPQVVEAMEAVFEEPGSERVEAEILTKDGRTVPYEFVAVTVENPEGEEVLAGIGRDITERKRREAELERTTELLEQAQQIASIGGWELDLETDEFTVTDEFRRLHGIEASGPVTVEDILSQYHPDEREYIRDTIDDAIERGQGYDMEVRLADGAGSATWVRALAEPVIRDGEVRKLRGSVQDITRAKEHEQALRGLHETAEGLLQTETATAVADLVVERAGDILDVEGVCLYLLEEADNRLAPVASTSGFGRQVALAPVAVGDEDNPIWNSFATGTRRVIDEVEESPGLFAEEVGGALVVPVGDHGVFAVTTGDPGIDERTRRLVETLVATTEAALDRLESEAAVRERDERVAEQNRRLRRQIQVTDVIRRVDRSLVGADSREAIEAAVTEQLVAAEDVAFAWIGAPDAGGDSLEPLAWAGSGDSYLDAVSLALADGNEPAARTARTGEPTVVSNVVADLRGDGWRKPALDSGFTSVLAVPIALEDYSYGVLAVYADDPDTFGDLEQEVFAELGRTIASAITAVQTREALHADRLLELQLDMGDSEAFLAQVARASGCPVEYVGTAAHSEGASRLFFAAECDASEALGNLVTVSEYRLLGEDDGRWVYEATVSGDTLTAKLLRHGASPQSIQATPSGLSVVVHVPTGTDVRELVEMLRETYATVDLEGRRTIERPTRTRQQVVSDVLADLTDRQREVLRTAYYAGFFDWPRDTTGEELAEMLDVTQPTVSRHLRLGQQRLLAELFDEEVVPAAA